MHLASSRPEGLRTDGRPHRRRTALAALALTALGLSTAVAAPAEAATVAAPRVRVMGGDGMLTATWSAVADASGYTVRVSEHRSLAKARVLHTTSRTAAIRKLRDGHTYYVGVTADRSGIGATAVSSAVAHTTAHFGAPTPVSDVAVHQGSKPNTFRVTWTGGDRVQKVGIVAGSNVDADQRLFHSAWYPATTQSITVTVPAKYRSVLGGGTGNPIYVKVAQSNSASTVFHHTFDYDDKYRTSTVGTWTLAAAAHAGGAVTKLRVAELNTQTNGATDTFSASNQWSARAPRVAKLVNAAKADLFMSAELSTNADAAGKAACHNTARAKYQCAPLTQYLQLAHRLTGLTLADPDAYARVLDQMKGFGGRYDGKVTDGAHVFYNRATLTLLHHGFLSPQLTASQSFSNVTGLGVPGWSSTSGIGGDRWLTWAEFRTKDASHRVFYAVAAHFPVGTGAGVVHARAQEAALAEAAISKMAGALPVVFAGDLNSDSERDPEAAQTVFIRHGWFDASAVSAKHLRTNIRYNTTNDSGPQTGADQGYPLRAYLRQWPTSRIDYILLHDSAHTYSYQNVLHLTADGTLDRSYQGSDHNLQLAVVGIGDPKG